MPRRHEADRHEAVRRGADRQMKTKPAPHALETPAMDRAEIETFPNPYPRRDYLIEHVAHEFTSVCPKTGEPDFATMTIRYVAGPDCLELRSLKQYLQTFRSKGIYYEDITNLILDHLVAACQPKWMFVESTWSVRGGLHTVVTAQHGSRPSCLASPRPE